MGQLSAEGHEPSRTGSVLIVEDERRIARIIELELIHIGLQVAIATDGPAGLRRALDEDFDLIMLDWMLPGMSGLEVCRTVRQEKQTPIIILTARDTTADKVAGLDAGADDYITKPFETEELLARVRVALRRGQTRQELTLGDLRVYPDERRAIRAGRLLELTAREFDLLHILLKNADRVLSRELILNQVWGYDYDGETNVVDVYIRYLRLKVDEPFASPLIHTMRGVGYVLRKG
ncbi:MAG: response regulator transcription factor [Firmicutes bacterium]|nr:response regulator transcription factor [Bacillota bacterium]